MAHTTGAHSQFGTMRWAGTDLDGPDRDTRAVHATAEEFDGETTAPIMATVIEADGQCIGHCRLHSLDKDNRSARYAIGIFNRAFWGKGCGSEATRLVLKHAFEEMKLHRVDLRVLSYNGRDGRTEDRGLNDNRH